MSLSGAVLSGGSSRRMGRNKALLDVDGAPMARLVADALRAVGCDPVFLVGGDPDELAEVGPPVLPDDHPGAGPVGGVLTALRLAPGDAFIVACDLPALTADVLAAVVDVADERPDADVVVARTDRIEPACALWRARSRPVVAEAFAAGERAMHRILGLLTVAEVPVPPAALHNVNTPDDL